VGCNFKCDFCQNSSISQADVERSSLMEITPKETVRMAKRAGCASIAWTYNEPTIWYEFTYDSSKLAHEAGIKNIYVTNGFINPEPLKNISPYLDAMNIDIKSFSEDFYHKIAGGRLNEVLDTCKLARDLNIHIELTYLVIPKLNDEAGEIEQYLHWVLRELGPDIPLHFSAFHPDFKMTDRERTPTSTLVNIYEQAKEMGLHYVFLGNVLADRGANTYCPSCDKCVIKRSYMGLRKNRIKDGKCPKCKTAIKIIQS
jgi:pyruvate formate lyase activating enzyme